MIMEGAQSVVLSPVPLWLLVVLPLLGGVLAAFGKTDPRATSARLIAPLVVTLLLGLGLAFVAGEGTLITPMFRLFRVGTLDLHLMLTLDRVDGLLAAGLAASALLLHLRQAEPSAPEGITMASIGFATTAGLVAILSSSVAGALLGVGVFLVAVVASKAGAGFVRAVLDGHARSTPLLLAGFVMLFWCLGGRFLDERLFFSDFGARFSVLGDAAESATIRGDERGSLTITTHPGAKIYLGITNEAQISAQPFGISPLVRAELPAGLHKVAVAPGDGAIVGGEGLEIALIDAVRIPSGGNTTIGVVGATTSYDEIERQTAAGSDVLGEKVLGPIRARSLIASLFAAGVIALSLSFLRLPSRGSLGAAWLAAIPVVIVGDALREVRNVFDGSRLVPSIGAVALVVVLVWVAKARAGRSESAFVAAASFATLALLVATGGSAFAPAVGVCGCFGALVSPAVGTGLHEKLALAARGGLGVFGIASGLAVAAACGIFGSNGVWGLVVTLAALALSFALAQALRPEAPSDTVTTQKARKLPTKKSKSAPPPAPVEPTAPSTVAIVSMVSAIALVPILLFVVRDSFSTLGPVAIVGGLMTLGAALVSARLVWKRSAQDDEPVNDARSFVDALAGLGNRLHALCGGSLREVKK